MSQPYFGGELPTDRFPYDAYLVDSGRSALRLILGSGFQGRTFLLPDFLCGIIPQVLTQLGAEFQFYHVGLDLQIDVASIKQQKFEVLYVIDYFGYRPDYESLLGAEQWVLEDCVFLPGVTRQGAFPRWLGFNSLRKASPLADGSVVVSTVPLKRELINSAEAPFASRKYAAKRLKQAFLSTGAGEEQTYLEEFARAEKEIDEQSEIYSIAGESLARYLAWLQSFDHELSRRRENLRILRERLGDFELRLESLQPSHFVMAIENRDELRRQMREHQIFFPSHWPHTHGPRNPLYDNIIAISLDSRYSVEEVARVADLTLKMVS